MIPVSLRLTDFLCYAAMPEPLDLTDLGLVCLVGANGHGKSALLDALTWGLWGRARGVAPGGGGQRRLVREGARRATVEVEFLAGGRCHRVERVRGPSGTEVRFGPLQGSTWDPLYGSPQEVQVHIDHAMGIDYDTFVRTSYLRQGDAGAFTGASTHERKAVLSRLLGLDRYGSLAEEARRRRLEEQRAIGALGAPTTVDVSGAARAAGPAAPPLGAPAAARARAARRPAGPPGPRRGPRARAREAAGLLAERSRYVAEVARAEAGLARLDDTAQVGSGDLGAALREAAEAARDAERVTAEIADLEGRRAEIRAALRVRRAELAAEAAGCREAARPDDIASRLGEAREARDRLPALDEQRAVAVAAAREARERAARRDGEARLAALRADALAQMRETDTSGACPVCERRWGEGPQGPHEATPARTAATAAEARRAAARARADAESADARAGEAARRRDAAARLAADVEGLSARLAGAAAAEHRCRVLAAEVEKIDGRLARGEPWAPEDRKLGALRAEQERLQTAAAHLGDLVAALETRRTAGVRREGLVVAATAARARLEETDGRLGRLGALPDPGCIEAAEAGVTAARGRLARAEADVSDRARDAGVAAEAHRAAREAAATQVRLGVERAAGVERLGRLQTLEEAFGQRGIPALVMESSLPGIQADANALLGELTRGRYGVRLDTRSETGRESLDVVVVDTAGGERGVELLSGGERLRVDLSLRLALARRSGCGTLIIDEGFGTQDAAGRHLVAEALESVAGHFGLVVAVTHFADLSDRFPSRIEVRSDASAGSVASVVR